MVTCTTRDITCCVSLTSASQIVAMCVSSLMCPTPRSTALRCESSNDCPAQDVCCLSQQNNNSGVAECRAACSNGDVQLCDPTAPDCPVGQSCQPPTGGVPPLLDGIGVCGG
jgi:hypothetical protein